MECTGEVMGGTSHPHHRKKNFFFIYWGFVFECFIFGVMIVEEKICLICEGSGVISILEEGVDPLSQRTVYREKSFDKCPLCEDGMLYVTEDRDRKVADHKRPRKDLGGEDLGGCDMDSW